MIKSGDPDYIPSGRGLLKKIGIVVPVVTAIAVAVPLIANWNERSSGPGALAQVTNSSTPATNPPSNPGETVEESPAAGEETDSSVSNYYPDGEAIGDAELPFQDSDEWLVPVSAPFSSFPDNGVEGEAGCTAEQLAWLESNAFPNRRSQFFDVTLQNTASSGAALSMGEIRFEGEEIPSEPWVFLECPHGGKGDGGGSQPILIDTQGTSAVWGETFADDNPQPIGSPVTLNLSPGEVAQVTFERANTVDTQRAYVGSFVADADGIATPVVMADNIEFVRAQLPGYYLGWGANYSELHCGTPHTDGADEDGYIYSVDFPCTIDEAAYLMSSLAKEFSGT